MAPLGLSGGATICSEITMTNKNHLKASVKALFLGAMAMLITVPVNGQVISNTAYAQWQHAGVSQTTQSNRVDVDVTPLKVTLSTFIPQPGASVVEQLRSDYCSNSNFDAGAPGASGTGTNTPISATDSLRIGQDLILRVDAPAANINGNTVDIIDIELTTQQGDRELLTGYESLKDSGIFLARISTRSIPPAMAQLDCTLSLVPDETISASVSASQQDLVLAYASVKALADPLGIVFDSYDGAPISGTRITLIDTATGSPANVYSFDGVTPWPSTVISGETVVDGAGNTHPFPDGRFQFPLVAFGTYKYQIDPPSPYSGPSSATPAQIAQLSQAGGNPFVINDASYLRAFNVVTLDPFEGDIPLDAPAGLVTISKSASLEQAMAGDVIFYDVTLRNTDQARDSEVISLIDNASAALRIKPDSIRVNGLVSDNSTLAADGRGFNLNLPSIPAGQAVMVRYAMSVRENATPGFALNIVTATPANGNAIKDQAQVEIIRDNLAGKMTLIGRVTESACDNPATALGIPNVRIMLEDGSYAITDENGRYHFEGLAPGTHIVHAASQTLPQGGAFVNCARTTRNAGSAISTIIRGQGGSLLRADFTARLAEGSLVEIDKNDAPPRFASDQENAGVDADWFANGDGPASFIFPSIEHNPRTPSIRVVIRHALDEIVDLSVDGVAADALSFEGSDLSPDKSWKVSIWRGIALSGASTKLNANVRGPDGEERAQLENTVHFADTPMFAQFIAEDSQLIADGASNPIVAIRLTDRTGKPLHAGVSGSFSIEGDYRSASEIDNRNSRQLTGFGTSASNWLVEGDEGIAYIKLAPTMISGALRLRFEFSDGTISREEVLDAWLEPGDQPWTIIGIAEATVGSQSVADLMEYGDNFDSDLGNNARIALYAKGRILGKYLLTLSYDSAKQKADQRLGSVIDPSAYYTIFGDGSARIYDAASREKLYVRIESSAFYALYGDFETGFDQTDLARYQRSATGIKTQARFGQVQINGFAAKIGSLHRRDEIQGGGVSGPYSLSSRRIIPNSETVFVEVRDRLRSEKIISREELTRFVDYTVDLLTGTIRFVRPLQSRDQFLNPQFAIVNYEIEEYGQGQVNAGLRVNWASKNGTLKIGASAVTDKGETSRSNLGAIDARLRVSDNSEIRFEAAVSEKNSDISQAYSLEAEHHTGRLDMLAYAKQIDADFGIGQQNLAERGRRKIGADARYNISDSLSVEASGWLDQSLSDASERRAADMRVTWQSDTTDAFIGLTHLDDTLADGTERSSNLLQTGATQRLLGNRLEVSAATSIELSNSETVDQPARHNFSARYKVSPIISVIGSYEIASGESHNSRALRGGLELTPWTGATASTTIGKESLGADSARTFAAVSLGQSIPLSSTLTLDANVDANRTIGGSISIDEVSTTAYPAGNGGHLSQSGELGEDFTAGGLGLSWAHNLWSARLRSEYRDGEFSNLAGISAAAIRQLGEGSVVGAGGSWTRTDSVGGASSEIIEASLSAAHRPADSAFAFLTKLEYRSDSVNSAVAGETGGFGRSTLLVNGNARSRRMIFSASSVWTPKKSKRKNGSSGRKQLSLFVAARHNFDQYEGQDYSGTTLLAGIDGYFAIGEKFDLGARTTARSNLKDGTASFAIGPEIGFSPVDGTVISVGYNITGFRDEDFSNARQTNKGIFASLRFKFDESLLGKIGL